MKKLIILLVIILFSCDDKEKYQGNWIYSVNSIHNSDAPSELIITPDSIKFRYTYFNFWNPFAYELVDSNIIFDGNSFDIKRIKDTLILNNHLKYIKVTDAENKKELEIEATNIKIELPKLHSNVFQEATESEDQIFIRYGRRHDNGNFALQLNDNYYEPFELVNFISSIRSSKREELRTYYKYYFFVDKNSLMEDIEKLLLSMALRNETRIFFVNDIRVDVENSDFTFYKLNYLSKRISPFIQQNYFDDNIGFCGPPPPLPPTSYVKDDSPIIYLLLIKDEIYFDNKKIEISEIDELIQNSIRKNSIIFSLYDLKSNFGSFLELNASINSAYYKIRDEKAQLKFSKSFSELDKDQSDSIKIAIPIKHEWNYSIPHYNSVLLNYNSFFKNGYQFFGLNVTPVDSMLIK